MTVQVLAVDSEVVKLPLAHPAHGTHAHMTHKCLGDIVDQFADKVYHLMTTATEYTQASVQAVGRTRAPHLPAQRFHHHPRTPDSRSVVSLFVTAGSPTPVMPHRNHCTHRLRPGHLHMARDCRSAHLTRTRVMALSSSFRDLLCVPVQLWNKGSHPFLIDTGAVIGSLPTSLAVGTDCS